MLSCGTPGSARWFEKKGHFSLGARIRWLRPDVPYAMVSRTVDRAFLFAPNHLEDNPLLRLDCPTDALSLENETVPKPSIINIIGSSIGRALEQHPINIHCYEANINHPHAQFSASEEGLENVSKFFQHTNSLIARQVNQAWKREGAVFTRARVTPCEGDASAEQQLLYAVTNPVKDGLISRVKDSPLFSTYAHQTRGESLRFWWIDWATYWKMGGPDNKKHHPKDYLHWTNWETTPLPHLAGLTVYQRQTRLRKLVREEEEKQNAIRLKENRVVIGAPALFETNPRSRPSTNKPKTPQPHCHADSEEAAAAYKENWKDFLEKYREASADFLAGSWEREFPQGSFRPPVIRMINGNDT